MKEPEIPENESYRQAAVVRYEILDTPTEENYDNITELMSQITGAPVSLITMLDQDRNYLKSHHGVPFSESPRNISFCGHAINALEPLTIIEDATQDPRFSDNPLVVDDGVRFYAGSPLVTPDGYRLGTLCLFDMQPRTLSKEHQAILINMTRQVEALLDLRYQNKLLKQTHKHIEEKYEELQSFANVVTHDIKSPLVSLAYAANQLEDDYGNEIDTKGLEIVHSLQESAGAVRRYVDDLLDYYTSDSLISNDAEDVWLSDIYDNVKRLVPRHAEVITSDNNLIVRVNRLALLQVLVNLLTNGIKYNDNTNPKIWVSFSQDDREYRFIVRDNGHGIEEKNIERIFDLYETAGAQKGDKRGTGIGLATVRKIVRQMGGDIAVKSNIGEGSEFAFTINRYPSPITLYR